MRLYGFRCPKAVDKRANDSESCCRKKSHKDKTTDKASGGHAGSVFTILGAKRPRHVISRSLTEKKPHSLNNCHQGKSYTHGGNLACSQRAYEVSIRHIVKRGNNHDSDTGKRQSEYKFFYRIGGHFYKFFNLRGRNCCCHDFNVSYTKIINQAKNKNK